MAPGSGLGEGPRFPSPVGNESQLSCQICAERIPAMPVRPGPPSLRQVLISPPGKPGPPFGVPDPPTASITALCSISTLGWGLAIGWFLWVLSSQLCCRTRDPGHRAEELNYGVTARSLLMVTLVLLPHGLTGPSWRIGDRGSAGLHDLPVMASAQGL